MTDVYEKASEAAKGTALATVELLDEVFTIESFQSVETKFGHRYVAIIRWPPDNDETQEAWLSGVVLSRQLEAIKDDLPATFSLARDEEPNSPYELVPPAQETPVVAAAKAAGATVKGRKAFDPLEAFRQDGKLDQVAFVRFWQDQGFGPDDLADIVGAAKMPAVEQWFKDNKGKTLEDLLAIAQANRDEPEELPFE